MTNIDASGKISTAQTQPNQPAPPQSITAVPTQAKAATSVSKLTHVLAGILATIAAFALTPAGQALIAQYPHLAVVSGLVATLASLYKAPSAD